ncbi:MAG: helix-turn-helix transcriptional regulator [Myxococcota bacterium]
MTTGAQDNSGSFWSREQLLKSISSTARDARQQMGATQEEIGEQIGVSSEYYGRIERGHTMPSVPTLCRMVRVLRVDADKMLGLDRLYMDNNIGDAPSSASSGSESNTPEPDSLKIRRLTRRLRRAHPNTLRLIDLLVRELKAAESGQLARDLGADPDADEDDEDEDDEDEDDEDEDDDDEDDDDEDEDDDDEDKNKGRPEWESSEIEDEPPDGPQPDQG